MLPLLCPPQQQQQSRNNRCCLGILPHLLSCFFCKFTLHPHITVGNIVFSPNSQMGFGPFYSARLVIHLLKSTADPQRGPSTAASAVAAVVQVEHLTALLEQYYHPSNTGACRECMGSRWRKCVASRIRLFSYACRWSFMVVIIRVT